MAASTRYSLGSGAGSSTKWAEIKSSLQQWTPALTRGERSTSQLWCLRSKKAWVTPVRSGHGNLKIITRIIHLEQFKNTEHVLKSLTSWQNLFVVTDLVLQKWNYIQMMLTKVQNFNCKKTCSFQPHFTWHNLQLV